MAEGWTVAVTLAAHAWSKKKAALFEEAVLRADHGTCRGCAEANDECGPDYGHFGVEPWLARNDFNSRRFLVDPSLAALLEFEVFHGICDIDVGTVDTGIFEGSLEKRASGTDEWTPGEILFIAGLLTDHNNTRRWRTFAQNGLSGVAV